MNPAVAELVAWASLQGAHADGFNWSGRMSCAVMLWREIW